MAHSCSSVSNRHPAKGSRVPTSRQVMVRSLIANERLRTYHGLGPKVKCGGIGLMALGDTVEIGRLVTPNEPRVSCGALMKDTFLNVRAPAASRAG